MSRLLKGRVRLARHISGMFNLRVVSAIGITFIHAFNRTNAVSSVVRLVVYPLVPKRLHPRFVKVYGIRFGGISLAFFRMFLATKYAGPHPSARSTLRYFLGGRATSGSTHSNG